MQFIKAHLIIFPCIFIRGVLIFPDVAADDQRTFIFIAKPSNPLCCCFCTFIIKSHSVYQRFIFWQTKQSWFRISALWQWSYFPISTKPKPNVSSSSRYFAFLSKPAARPTGFENVIPKTSFEKIPWGVSFFFKNFFVKENLHKNRSMFIEK